MLWNLQRGIQERRGAGSLEGPAAVRGGLSPAAQNTNGRREKRVPASASGRRESLLEAGLLGLWDCTCYHLLCPLCGAGGLWSPFFARPLLGERGGAGGAAPRDGPGSPLSAALTEAPAGASDQGCLFILLNQVQGRRALDVPCP